MSIQLIDKVSINTSDLLGKELRPCSGLIVFKPSDHWVLMRMTFSIARIVARVGFGSFFAVYYIMFSLFRARVICYLTLNLYYYHIRML